MFEANIEWQAALASARPKLAAMPERVAGRLVTLGVLASPTLNVPLAKHSARFAGLKAKVFLCASCMLEPLSPLTTHH